MQLRFYRNSLWQLVALLAPAGAEFVTAYQVTSHLGLETYGLLSFAYALCLLFHLLLDLRLTEAAIQFLSPHLEKNPRQAGSLATQLVLVEVACRVLALGLSLLASFWVPRFVEEPGIVPITQATALMLFLNYLITGPCRGILRICNGFFEQAAVAAAAAILKVAVVAWVTRVTPPDPITVAWWLTLSSLPLPLFYLVGCHRVMTRQGLNFQWPEGSWEPSLSKFIRFNYLASLTMIPTRELDVTLLAGCTDIASLGAYKLAKNFVAVLWLLGDALFLASYPELSRLVHQQDWARLRHWLRSSTFRLGAFGAGVLVLGWIFFPPLLARLFPAAGPLVPTYFHIMILALPFWTAFLWINPLVLALGRPEIFAYGSFLGGAAVTLLYLLAIPHGQAWGAAVVTSLSTPLVLGFILILALRRAAFKPLMAVN